MYQQNSCIAKESGILTLDCRDDARISENYQ